MSIPLTGSVAAAARVWLSANGSAIKSDRSAADSEAYSQATTSLNNECIGVVEQDTVEKTGDNCVRAGSDDNPSGCALFRLRVYAEQDVS